MTATHIRPYTEADLPSVDALWRVVFPDDPQHNRASVAVAEKERFQSGLIFLAEMDGDVIGTTMAGYDGHRGWLYAVAVHPDHRRAGIATELVNQAVAALHKMGCCKVNLQVRAGNEGVVKFYEALGFSVEPRVSMGKRL